MTPYLVFDLDGTMITSKGTLNVYVRDDLRNLHDRGLIKGLVIATGRHYFECQEIVAKMGSLKPDFLICCDGQYIFDARGNLLWKNSYLNVDDVEYFCGLKEVESLSVITDKYDYWYDRGINIKRRINALRIRKVKIFSKRMREINGEKIVIKGTALKTKGKIENNYMVYRLYDTIVIQPKGVSKYHALKRAESRGWIQCDRCIYFGDDYNDLQCFKYLKYAYAMSQSPKEIMQLAMGIIDFSERQVLKKLVEEIGRAHV